MSDLVAIGYDSLASAQEVSANAAQLQKAHELELDDMVIVEHRMDGKIKLHQPSAVRGGALGGALWGGLLGMIFFVPFLGMAIGAAGGAAAGAASDYGVDDQFMKDLGAQLAPGHAALIMLVREASTDKILPNLKVQGTIIQTSLDDAAEAQLSAALSSAGGR